MNETEMSPLEQVLRYCQQAAPQPWYPRAFARQSGTSKEDLSLDIEHLLLDGLLERTTGTAETGPGLVLSAHGVQLLRDPEALERLRQGTPVTDGDRGGIVRETLRRNATPYISRTLLALNLVVFAYGIYLASSEKIVQAFLTGMPDKAAQYRPFVEVLAKSGSTTAESWLTGEWWRAATACFVHFGVLHLFMNMYMLYAAGGFVERMWGRVRFLLIYLISGFVGSCVGLAHHTPIVKLTDKDAPEWLTGPLAGASTALCGILAAEAIWVWLNGKYLPTSQAERWRNNILIQGALIVFISFFPGISGWGHFGGAVGGALTALILHYQRFAPSPWRWVAAVALLPLPCLGLLEIQRMRRCRDEFTLNLVVVRLHVSDTEWEDVEILDYKKRFENRIHTKMKAEEQREFQDRVGTLLDMEPARREEAKKAEVEKALAYLGQERQQWSEFLAVVNQAGPYYQPPAQEQQSADREAIAAHSKLFELAEHCLREGKNWKPEDEAALTKQRQFVKEAKVKDDRPKPADNDPEIKPAVQGERTPFKKEFLDQLIQTSNGMTGPGIWDSARAEALKPPIERVQKVVDARLKEVEALRRKMSGLAKDLDQAGPFKDEELEIVRKVARDSRLEWAKLLEQTESSLRDGTPWKGEEQQKRARQLQDDLHEALRALEWVS